VVSQQITPERIPTMTDTGTAQAESVLAAIGISRARHEVLIAAPGKKCRRRSTVLNS